MTFANETRTRNAFLLMDVFQCRVGLGLGEGFAFPSVHAMIAENVPRKQRSTVVSESSTFRATGFLCSEAFDVRQT